MFRLHEGSIKKDEIVAFLKALKAHLKQPLLVIWDGLKAHRSRLVREYLDSLDGYIQIAFLPPYAPDMNPVEYLWAWLKRHALANYCPSNLSELHTTARNKLKSAQKRPSCPGPDFSGHEFGVKLCRRKGDWNVEEGRSWGCAGRAGRSA